MATRPFFRRRRLLVNYGLQIRFVLLLLLQMTFVLTVLGLLVMGHVNGTAELALNLPVVDGTNHFALQQDVFDNIHGFYMRSLFLLGTTVAVMVLFGLLSSHKLAGPVVSLERHLRAVADGNYESRVTFRKKDNLDDFAQGLNQMAEAIENRRNRARQIAAEIWRRCEGLPSGSDSPSFLADAERLIARYKEAL